MSEFALFVRDFFILVYFILWTTEQQNQTVGIEQQNNWALWENRVKCSNKILLHEPREIFYEQQYETKVLHLISDTKLTLI